LVVAIRLKSYSFWPDTSTEPKFSREIRPPYSSITSVSGYTRTRVGTYRAANPMRCSFLDPVCGREACMSVERKMMHWPRCMTIGTALLSSGVKSGSTCSSR
jgi:hypothetical protein